MANASNSRATARRNWRPDDWNGGDQSRVSEAACDDLSIGREWKLDEASDLEVATLKPLQ